MLVAPKGKLLISVDLAQAESWVVAYLADEPHMKYALHNGDIHLQTAGSALFFNKEGCNHDWDKEARICNKCHAEVTKPMRYIGKRYNHASAYRMTYMRAAQVINKDSDKPPYMMVTLAESKEYSESWHSYYNIKPWWSEIEYELGKTRTLTTPYKRTRYFFAQWGPELFKEATADVPQSTVADHFNGRIQKELGIKGGLIEVYRQLVIPYEENKIVNQSHDSLVMETPKEIAREMVGRVKELLYRPLIIKDEQFSIPVDAEIGERWGELEAA